MLASADTGDANRTLKISWPLLVNRSTRSIHAGAASSVGQRADFAAEVARPIGRPSPPAAGDDRARPGCAPCPASRRRARPERRAGRSRQSHAGQSLMHDRAAVDAGGVDQATPEPIDVAAGGEPAARAHGASRAQGRAGLACTAPWRRAAASPARTAARAGSSRRAPPCRWRASRHRAAGQGFAAGQADRATRHRRRPAAARPGAPARRRRSAPSRARRGARTPA